MTSRELRTDGVHVVRHPADAGVHHGFGRIANRQPMLARHSRSRRGLSGPIPVDPILATSNLSRPCRAVRGRPVGGRSPTLNRPRLCTLSIAILPVPCRIFSRRVCPDLVFSCFTSSSMACSHGYSTMIRARGLLHLCLAAQLAVFQMAFFQKLVVVQKPRSAALQRYQLATER